MTTKKHPTASELLELVRRYYPAGLESHDPRYDASPEIRRLRAVIEPEWQALQEGRRDTKWARFKKRLHGEFPGRVYDSSPPMWEPCHRVRLLLPDSPDKPGHDDDAVALISVLAPVFAIYASHRFEQDGDMERWVKFPPLPAEFREWEARLAALIEEEYGFVRLPNDVLFTPVPDRAPVADRLLGEARLIDLLLTPDRW